MMMESKELHIKYGDRLIVKDASLAVEEGEVISIIGPNGSGKTTLIKALSRCIKIDSGRIFFQGRDIRQLASKEIARQLAVVPQVKFVSADISVENLVAYGRYPHLAFGKRLTKEDKDIISWAIDRTGLAKFRDRPMAKLSGGESQRAWIAMALAQRPRLLILDEPTTYLDISYQLEVLELVKELNESLGITVIMVLHDLNQAARYSDRIYVLQEGRICHYGSPKKIIRRELLEEVFRIDAEIYQDEINDCPYFIANKIIGR